MRQGPTGCAFAGDSAQRFAALAEMLKQGPIEIIDPFTGEPFLLHYSDAIGETLRALYDSSSWPEFALLLALIEQDASPEEIGKAMAAVEAKVGLAAGSLPEPRYPNFVEGFPSVSCSDSVNPDDHGYWSIAGAESDAQFGYFGRIWTWFSSICAVWQGFDQDRYLGPFDRDTANPVLVVGTRYDPATRYEGSSHRRRPAPQLEPAHRRGLGPHLALPLRLRRRGDRRLSPGGDDTAARDRVHPGLRPVPRGRRPTGRRHPGATPGTATRGDVGDRHLPGEVNPGNRFAPSR